MTTRMVLSRPGPAGWGVLAAALVLSACANPANELALGAQRLLVGVPKTELLACAGVPERQATADGKEFFTYTRNRLASYPGAPLGYHGGGWYPGWGWPGYAGEVRSYTCEATFTLRNGVVERVVYNGVAGDLGECYAIVRTCTAGLAPGPTPAPPAGAN